MQPRSIALLLPPAVCAVLGARIDATGFLPTSMVSSIVARIYADTAARERLHTTAQGLWTTCCQMNLAGAIGQTMSAR